MNYGLKIPKIETKEEGVEYVLGSSKLKGEIINPSGDWGAFLSTGEVQNKGKDLNSCVIFGTSNAYESRLTQLGKDENWSEPYMIVFALRAGILKEDGSDPHAIGEMLRT